MLFRSGVAAVAVVADRRLAGLVADEVVARHEHARQVRVVGHDAGVDHRDDRHIRGPRRQARERAERRGQIDQAHVFITDLERYHQTYLKAGLLNIQAAFAIGDSENALKLANELINKTDAATPNAETNQEEMRDLRTRALSSRGLAYLGLGKLPEAKADLQEIVKRSPHSSAARRWRDRKSVV